ncbi:hypothetical protein ACIA8O_36900 [Kitasatospora sp. NPDC051853]|uniref:hypothetical protein n=1 Tax=Kitasatospora sp. NPDC051853 TaxID=3364058 RepID=UPI0037BDECD7
MAHLARHARREQLPPHLRFCRCATGGCSWHVGTRRCGGQIVLVVFSDWDGSSWRLADVCEQCARSIPRTVRLPAPRLTPPPPDRPPVPSAARTHQLGHLATRAALAYTAASLPPTLGAEARLLAVVCALRTGTSGIARLPPGLHRALRITAPARALTDLQEAGWLHYLSRPRGGPAVLVPELAGTPCRRPDSHWAIRLLTHPRVAIAPARDRLTVLAVSSWLEHPGTPYLVDPAAVTRACGTETAHLHTVLDDLKADGTLTRWQPLPNGLLRCHPSGQPPAPRRQR